LPIPTTFMQNVFGGLVKAPHIFAASDGKVQKPAKYLRRLKSAGRGRPAFNAQKPATWPQMSCCHFSTGVSCFILARFAKTACATAGVTSKAATDALIAAAIAPRPNSPRLVFIARVLMLLKFGREIALIESIFELSFDPQNVIQNSSLIRRALLLGCIATKRDRMQSCLALNTKQRAVRKANAWFHATFR
jgi:hypothetical protein